MVGGLFFFFSLFLFLIQAVKVQTSLHFHHRVCFGRPEVRARAGLLACIIHGSSASPGTNVKKRSRFGREETVLLLLLVTVLFANKQKNILGNRDWARQRELLFPVWAGMLPAEIGLVFGLQGESRTQRPLTRKAGPSAAVFIWAAASDCRTRGSGLPAGVPALAGYDGGGGQGTVQEGEFATKGGGQALDWELLEGEPRFGALGWRKPSRLCRIYLLSGPNCRKIVGSTFRIFVFPQG